MFAPCADADQCTVVTQRCRTGFGAPDRLFAAPSVSATPWVSFAVMFAFTPSSALCDSVCVSPFPSCAVTYPASPASGALRSQRVPGPTLKVSAGMHPV